MPLRISDVSCVPWNPFQAAPKEHALRRAPRHEAHGLRCPLGELKDISTSGLRCQTQGKPSVTVGQVVPLVIRNEGQAIKVHAQVVWVRRLGGVMSKTFQIGVRFQSMTPKLERALDQLARFGYVNTSELVEENEPVPEPRASHAATAAAVQASAPSQHAAPGTAEGGPPRSVCDIEIEDLYRVLEVLPTADDTTIKKAYHEQAKRWHPDVNKEEGAREKFEDVNKAFQVLRDPNLRRRYDQMLRASKTMHRRSA
jgi:DnaJ-domain-containing protein 1